MSTRFPRPTPGLKPKPQGPRPNLSPPGVVPWAFSPNPSPIPHGIRLIFTKTIRCGLAPLPSHLV
ncbi:hypothetical protein Hanom_Chr16g01474611 [Helianthus anomalus]